MANHVPSDLLEKWLSAWALSRQLPLPKKYKSGYKVEVGDKQQKARYVFSVLNDDFIQLSASINETWVFLKVCASAEEVKNKIGERWVIQPQGYMMSCVSPMRIPNKGLPQGYHVVLDSYHSTSVIKVTSEDGRLAAIGRLVMIDGLAVYDRISTEEGYQRKGLATFVMAELEKIAVVKNAHLNFLVATEKGKLLYQTLGWKVFSPYTSVVIPA